MSIECALAEAGSWQLGAWSADRLWGSKQKLPKSLAEYNQPQVWFNCEALFLHPIYEGPEGINPRAFGPQILRCRGSLAQRFVGLQPQAHVFRQCMPIFRSVAINQSNRGVPRNPNLLL
jgi:hypothetical protein